ncbi:MAG: hypothetical protein IJ740_07100 [Ruminococcus sp.]|nr:hypothetical protein [Ruminococcus sp.]
MDKDKALEKAKRYTSRFFLIRRIIRIVFAIGAGISSGIVTFRQAYDLTGRLPVSLAAAFMLGTFVAVFGVGLLELVRLIISLLKKLGLKILKKLRKGKKKEE